MNYHKRKCSKVKQCDKRK